MFFLEFKTAVIINIAPAGFLIDTVTNSKYIHLLGLKNVFLLTFRQIFQVVAESVSMICWYHFYVIMPSVF